MRKWASSFRKWLAITLPKYIERKRNVPVLGERTPFPIVQENDLLWIHDVLGLVQQPCYGRL